MAHVVTDGGTLPRSGDVLLVTRAASVQFATPMLFRVIRVLDWPTYTGWVWLDGYELGSDGEATDRRAIFVQADGLRPAPGEPAAATRPAHQGRRPSPPRGHLDPSPR